MKNIDVATAQPMTIGFLASTIPAEEVLTWPEHSKTAVLEAIANFGIPDVVASEVLIWKNGSNPVVIEKHHGYICSELVQ